MMYQAWRRPGTQPSMQRQILMRESAEQMPHLTQTVVSVSLPFARHKDDGGEGESHTCERREEDGEQAEEDIRRAHLGFKFEGLVRCSELKIVERWNLKSRNLYLRGRWRE
jgi:hypothetical protein